jgi:uncharacterized protein (UPF0261 family)
MRTNAAESAELGRIIAGKVNACTAPVTVLIPRHAVSIISAPGQPFHNPGADDALFSALKNTLRPGIEIMDTPLEINDPAFARMCADALLKNMRVASAS